MDIPAFIDSYGYLAVFLGAFLEGETVLGLAGLAAYRGYMEYHYVVLIAIVAAFLGDQVYFFLGRFRGQKIMARFPHAEKRAQRFDAMLSRWHAPLIIALRFMYGFRIVGPILLGMGRVPAWKFVLYNFIGASLWAPLIAGIGYYFGGVLESVLHHMKRYEVWVFVGIALIGVALAVYHHRRADKIDDEKVP
jgi:membrane protein DedA with SNARE-associated domain